MTANLFAPYQDLASLLLPHTQATQDDGAHDLSHLLRVWKNVCAIRNHEGGDAQVLVAATLLHDCVAVEKNSPFRASASRLAAARAAELLTEMGWDEEHIAQVAHAIEAHSYSAAIAPRSLEARILQDADRLDALGTVGIARWMTSASPSTTSRPNCCAWRKVFRRPQACAWREAGMSAYKGSWTICSMKSILDRLSKKPPQEQKFDVKQ